MKIGIVTVYNSQNSGSFLQAFTLGQAITKLGHTVSYIKRHKKNTSASFKIIAKKIIYKLIKFKFKEALSDYKSYLKFNKAVKQLDIVARNSNEYRDIDCIILGSDTIWHTNYKYFNKYYETYWGMNFEGKKIIAYAPSINTTELEDLMKFDFPRVALENMSNIGVRDSHTLDVISKFTDKPISIVCDPTLLFSASDYEKWKGDCSEENFILIYCFYEVEDAVIKEIKAFAKQHNKKIISFGRKVEWCDDYVPNDPFSFLAYFLKADYIVTNTFHGTIFSINFEKKFVSFGRKSTKVIEALNQFGLSNRNVKADSAFGNILQEEIDYIKVAKIKQELVKNSINYLTNSLEGNQ